MEKRLEERGPARPSLGFQAGHQFVERYFLMIYRIVTIQ